MLAFRYLLVYMSVMCLATGATDNSFSARFLIALLSVLALFAATSPDVPRSAVLFSSHGDLAYDVGFSDLAVLPKLERGQRQRPYPAVPPLIGETPGVALDLALVFCGPASRSVPPSSRIPSRFHHLEERTSAPRAPPILV